MVERLDGAVALGGGGSQVQFPAEVDPKNLCGGREPSDFVSFRRAVKKTAVPYT